MTSGHHPGHGRCQNLSLRQRLRYPMIPFELLPSGVAGGAVAVRDA
jgi:hypothetical protein